MTAMKRLCNRAISVILLYVFLWFSYTPGVKRTEHGTRAAYSGGCRCRECKSAWARYIRERARGLGRQTPEQALVAREIEQAEQRIPHIVEENVDTVVTVPLTPLEFQILIALQKQTNQRRAQIFGQLLRDHAVVELDDDLKSVA